MQIDKKEGEEIPGRGNGMDEGMGAGMRRVKGQ